MLQSLSFHRPNDAQPNRRCHEAAQVKKKKQPHRARTYQAKRPGGSSEHGREMSAGRRTNALARENFLRRGKKGASLKAAGAIGHVIGEKSVAILIQHAKLLRFVVRGSEERQAPLSKLP